MGIQRHEPCVHGKDPLNCVFCVMEAKIENLVDRMEDLEEMVYTDPNPSSQVSLVETPGNEAADEDVSNEQAEEAKPEPTASEEDTKGDGEQSEQGDLNDGGTSPGSIND